MQAKKGFLPPPFPKPKAPNKFQIPITKTILRIPIISYQHLDFQDVESQEAILTTNLPTPNIKPKLSPMNITH